MKKRFICVVCIGFALASCSKSDESSSAQNNPQGADNLANLSISSTFNWSSSSKGKLNVSLDAPANLVTDGAPILLLDENQKVVDRSVIINNQASFFFIKPQSQSDIYLYYPNTEESMPINEAGNVSFSIGRSHGIAGKKSSFLKKAHLFSSKAQINVLINGDFSNNNLGTNTSDYDVLRPTGKWYEGSQFGNLITVGGNQVYQSTSANTEDPAIITQSVATSSGTTYSCSYSFNTQKANDIVGYLDFFDISGNHLAYTSIDQSTGSLSGITPANCAFIQMFMYLTDSAFVDDVILDVSSALDSDNDGVADVLDDFPNDVNRSYISYFPTSGYQTLLFEDLWPSKGDYDFNDIVVSSNIVYSLNSNNDKVDATVTITLDAAGAGIPNGLAIVFTDGNKQFLSQNIIASVSGDAILDPNVTNGLIIFDDVFTAQSQYYQNNGVGPTAVADSFSFTITFNANAGSQPIIPDTYIFRSNDRGVEIHLDEFKGTSAANTSYYNTGDDVNGTYTTATGIPWAVEVVTSNKSFQHPLEKVDILVAYPLFQQWAQSNGVQNTDWYNAPANGKTFQ